MSHPSAFQESLDLRQLIIQEQGRQSVAQHKQKLIKEQIQSLEIELKLWENVYATSQFKIETMNEILRVGEI